MFTCARTIVFGLLAVCVWQAISDSADAGWRHRAYGGSSGGSSGGWASSGGSYGGWASSGGSSGGHYRRYARRALRWGSSGGSHGSWGSSGGMVTASYGSSGGSYTAQYSGPLRYEYADTPARYDVEDQPTLAPPEEERSYESRSDVRDEDARYDDRDANRRDGLVDLRTDRQRATEAAIDRDIVDRDNYARTGDDRARDVSPAPRRGTSVEQASASSDERPVRAPERPAPRDLGDSADGDNKVDDANVPADPQPTAAVDAGDDVGDAESPSDALAAADTIAARQAPAAPAANRAGDGPVLIGAGSSEHAAARQAPSAAGDAVEF